MGTKRNQMDATFDATLQLKDAAAVAVTGAAQVGGAARVVNVGPAILSGTFVVDIIALTINADASYDMRLQASSDPTFASDVSIVARVNSTLTATSGEDRPGVGRRSMPFNNIGEDGAAKTYLRAFHVISGTGPSINYTAMVTQNPLP